MFKQQNNIQHEHKFTYTEVLSTILLFIFVQKLYIFIQFLCLINYIIRRGFIKLFLLLLR